MHNPGSQVTFRYIKYRCPNTGLEYEFVTNHMKIRPGVLAWLYKRRWDIEKTYDTLKNKMNECKAWARSANAKTMQAQFLCLAHNPQGTSLIKSNSLKCIILNFMLATFENVVMIRSDEYPSLAQNTSG